MSMAEAKRRIEEVRQNGGTVLDLSHLELETVPDELWALSSLTRLVFRNTQLNSMPSKLGNLSSLKELDLRDTQLSSVPPELGDLSSLTMLDLRNTELKSVPPELGNLSSLTWFYLSNTQLNSVPSELCNLSSLKVLSLSRTKLNSVPPELGNLSSLMVLDLRNTELNSVPPELGNLSSLTRLDLSNTKLSSIPSELGNLSSLKVLDLNNTKLSSVPSELGNLSSLKVLDLSNTKLSSVPPELGNLSFLTHLYLDDPLPFPLPPEMSRAPAQRIVAFLKALTKREPQWVSKMLVVGEGGVGKTSLLRALLAQEFNLEESSTHGIEIFPIDLLHPNETDVIMRLNAWDFGGQEIYHATHQFFLTNRSLFILVWNARLDHEQGNLYYWLDAIKSRAPQSPIFIVATHTDERDARVPLRELQEAYPNIVAHHAVSCKSGNGIDGLRRAIRGEAAKLPLMGESWPKYWLQAANIVRQHPDNHIPTAEFFDLLTANGVVDKNAKILANWLHELGDILYYADDETINDTVILKPQWVTAHISRVLTSENVANNHAILTRDEMNRLWKDLPVSLRDHFLRIMEQFDLSYRTKQDRDKSLVVERLSLDPEPYETAWEAKQNAQSITMRYKLNTIPAGVPTWFIARQHRFTTYTHWKTGVLFADNGSDKTKARHLGLVRAYEHNRTLELTVRGPAPYSFFNLLHDGLELTLARFPGLDITRLIPCPDPTHEQCDHYFKYENLLKRLERNKPTIECPSCFEDIAVTQLVFGIDDTSKDLVLDRLDKIGGEVRKQGKKTRQQIGKLYDELVALRELSQRQHLAQFEREQRFADSHTPSIFKIFPTDTAWHKRLIIGQTLRIDLCCEAPGEWHPLVQNDKRTGTYEFDLRRDWITNNLTFIKATFALLQLAAPFAAPWLEMERVDLQQEWGHHIDAMERFLDSASELVQDEFEFRYGDRFEHRDLHARGSQLREIRALLDELDPRQHWGGLRKVLTPEGHYLWLCEHHAAEYLP
ncbi:MAG: COR domain-containing protein [Candidatus Promineifilaceae bacterium]